jgi:ribonuclease T2
MESPEMLRLILVLAVLAGPLRAGGTAGEFDYYVMALSWSPNWCARTGNDRDSPQCATGSDFGWVLHGLWPQYARGWPDYCATTHRAPTPVQTTAQAGLFGSARSARHQWAKHGVCSGLSADAYYDLSATAYARVTRPQVFRDLDDPVRLPARVVEQAFLRDNPALSADAITVTCRSGGIAEARICLTRDLDFRDCGADVRRDCALDDALLAPIR